MHHIYGPLTEFQVCYRDKKRVRVFEKTLTLALLEGLDDKRQPLFVLGHTRIPTLNLLSVFSRGSFLFSIYDELRYHPVLEGVAC